MRADLDEDVRADLDEDVAGLYEDVAGLYEDVAGLDEDVEDCLDEDVNEVSRCGHEVNAVMRLVDA